jgi:hypothetical protein
MKARIITSAAAAGVLALVVSCSQDQSRGISAPTEASFLKPPPAPTCSFSTANQDARAYFSNTKDPVFLLLDAQQTAYKGGASAATSAGLDVLGRLGIARDSGLVSATSTDSLGSKFVNDVLRCTDLTSGGDYSRALGDSGLFAVRSVGDQAAVLSRHLEDGIPLYGAEPTTSDGWKFTGGASNRALFYASPKVTTIKDPTVGTVFDLQTLPTPLAFDPQIRVGVCDMADTTGRIEHVHGSAVILPRNDPTFCTGTSVMSESSGSLFASAAHEIASWFTPRPAYAAARMMPVTKLGGGGGLVSGLSEIGPVQVLEALSIDRIRNASVSDTALAHDTLSTGEPNLTTSQFNPIVRVRVATTKGTPIAGVTVILTVVGNKGSFAADGGSAVTNALGYASFPDFNIDKAGGYTITATVPELGGDVVATSNLFNIGGR